MNRDNFLFVLIGLLAGFMGGYLAHEAMSERQPARRPAGAAAAVDAPAQAPPTPPGGAPMQQVAELRARVEEHPDDAGAVRLLGNMNYDIGNWQGAAELYEHYLGLEPGDVDVLTDLGACYRNLGRPEEALARFREARQESPGHWQSRYNEILVLAFDLGRWQEARTAMGELRELEPANADVERLATELERRAPEAGA